MPNSIKENVLGAPITIPAQYADLIKEATTRCPAISEELFAAQLHAESSFNPMAESPAGAQGIAQFMPYTWKHYGIDGDDDGLADVWNPVDAIHSAARMNCINRKLVKGLDGPRIKHTFAAYNAGVGTVLEYGGIPPFPETQSNKEQMLEISTWTPIMKYDNFKMQASQVFSKRDTNNTKLKQTCDTSTATVSWNT